MQPNLTAMQPGGYSSHEVSWGDPCWDGEIRHMNLLSYDEDILHLN